MSSSRSTLDSINGPVRQILKDLIRSAKQRKSKSTAALCEAYASLKACPIKFTSIEELLPLTGFGEALLDQIEMKFCEWCDSHNKMYPQSRPIASTSALMPAKMTSEEETDSDLDERAPPKKVKVKIITTATTQCTRKTKERTEKASKTKKIAPGKEPKSYIPQQRTGTHGILVALYTLTPSRPPMDDEDEANAGTHYYTKTTIIYFAQPYSDSKYIPKQSSAPSSGFGSNFHSAWSGMKTLINRGYVYRRGNPGRFGLSHEGWSIAETCAGRETNLTPGSNISKLSSVPSTSKSSDKANAKEKRKKKSKEDISDNDDSTEMVPTKGGPLLHTARQGDGPFLYIYLTDADPPLPTLDRIEASIRLDDLDYRINYRIAYPMTLSSHPFVRKCVRDISQEGNLMSGWVKESVCNERAPGLPEQEKSTSTEVVQKKISKSPLQAITNSYVPPSSQEKALSQLTCSQREVIDLLTSSDVELDGAHSFKMAVSTRAPIQKKGKKDNGNESDSSALSDLAPIKKAPRKQRAVKAVR